MLQISCGIVAQWSCKFFSGPHYSSKSIGLMSFFCWNLTIKSVDDLSVNEDLVP